jgi:adenosine 3'-phospho 5'-phosphosulfate transporter B2
MRSLFIAAALQACFITYGILKEQIVTEDHIASPVLILSSRLMSVLLGAIALLATEGRIHFSGTPLTAFVAFGFTNEASTWAGYEMLKYVSFPVQVMAKSCKLLPSMLMGKLLNGDTYERLQYAQAVGAMICVTVMHLSEAHKENGKKKAAAEDDMSDLFKGLCGITLLIVFFACDSFTSQWQTALYKKYTDLTKTQMMLSGNLMGLCITVVSIVPQWAKVSASLSMAMENPAILFRILLLGLSAAMGQFCIYTAIKVLGPLAFTWIMTTRQLLSVIISLVMFGHGVSTTKLLCIFTVFAIMSSKQLAKAGRQAAPLIKKCATCKRSESKDPPRLWSSPRATPPEWETPLRDAGTSEDFHAKMQEVRDKLSGEKKNE